MWNWNVIGDFNPLTMPFRSKAQQRACYASKGFDGAVDCMKWAKKTNFGKLKERVHKPMRKSYK